MRSAELAITSLIYPTGTNGIINSLNSKSLEVRKVSGKKQENPSKKKKKQLDEDAMLWNTWWSDSPRLVTKTLLTFLRTSKRQN